MNERSAVTNHQAVLGVSDSTYTDHKLASMYLGRVQKLIAIGAGEQIPGLKKVLFKVKKLLSLAPAYSQQQRILRLQPERLEEFWTGTE